MEAEILDPRRPESSTAYIPGHHAWKRAWDHAWNRLLEPRKCALLLAILVFHRDTSAQFLGQRWREIGARGEFGQKVRCQEFR